MLWFDIGDKKAIEKTSQALRDSGASLRKQLSEDLGGPDFLKSVFNPKTAKERSDVDKVGGNIEGLMFMPLSHALSAAQTLFILSVLGGFSRFLFHA